MIDESMFNVKAGDLEQDALMILIAAVGYAEQARAKYRLLPEHIITLTVPYRPDGRALFATITDRLTESHIELDWSNYDLLTVHRSVASERGQGTFDPDNAVLSEVNWASPLVDVEKLWLEDQLPGPLEAQEARIIAARLLAAADRVDELTQLIKLTADWEASQS